MLALWWALLGLAAGAGREGREKRQAGRGHAGIGTFLNKEFGIDTTWIQDYRKGGPFGVVLKGWQFAPCADSAWAKYPMNVSNVQLWPKYPRFPGPIFFNVSFDVNYSFQRAQVLRPLPGGPIELETKVRHKVRGAGEDQHRWEVIPCTGWDLATGCGGGGSCRYCDVMDVCRKTAAKAKKYTENKKLLDVLSNTEKLCPPPPGTWSVSYSKVFKLADVEHGVLGPLQSNEYWFNVKVKSTLTGEDLGCFRLWVDVCKYRFRSRRQLCIRDPSAFRSFVDRLTAEARHIFGPKAAFPATRN